ncbi:MAG: hypothetical protein V2B19_08725 [Pseudomonadota bacterium]
MIARQAYRKKYVRFSWWQYGRWFAVIIFVTFCIGVAAGFFAGQRWGAAHKPALLEPDNAAW